MRHLSVHVEPPFLANFGVVVVAVLQGIQSLNGRRKQARQDAPPNTQNSHVANLGPFVQSGSAVAEMNPWPGVCLFNFAVHTKSMKKPFALVAFLVILILRVSTPAMGCSTPSSVALMAESAGEQAVMLSIPADWPGGVYFLRTEETILRFAVAP